TYYIHLATTSIPSLSLHDALPILIIPLSFQYVFVDSLTALGMTRISLGLSLIRQILYFGTVCLLPLVFSAKSAFYGEPVADGLRSEEHTSELQSRFALVCRLLLEK